MIILLTVIGLQHHVLFVALESLLDMIHPVLHGCLFIPLRLLHDVRSAVERQDQEVDHQTDPDDGNTGIFQQAVHKYKDDLNDQHERLNDQIVEDR